MILNWMGANIARIPTALNFVNLVLIHYCHYHSHKSRDSDWLRTGWSGFESWCRLGIFLFTTASRTALRPTQPPIQRVPGALSLGVKRPGRETDHSPPSSAEVRNAWSYTSTHPIRLYGVVLSKKHRDNFTFICNIFTLIKLCKVK
jgi:hypothetical protein